MVKIKKRTQLNVRTDLFTDMLIDKLAEKLEMKKTDVVLKAIANFGAEQLSDKEMNELLLLAAKEKLGL